jgi:hypothetical protein
MSGICASAHSAIIPPSPKPITEIIFWFTYLRSRSNDNSPSTLAMCSYASSSRFSSDTDVVGMGAEMCSVNVEDANHNVAIRTDKTLTKRSTRRR